ncbi:MAG TPA: glycosyltransferase family A protein [Stellaceae bacterium]|nr:glycosyltransferase family A protein [Stellaceae bacterium]
MLVSVIVPACAAEGTIGRCIASLLAQSYPCWEAVIVADDGQDYAALLAGIGLVDPRLRFVSTGAVRSGCHNARNVGLAAARGEIIAQLDADDLYDPCRLAALAPLAAAHGAVVDRVAVVSDGGKLYTAPSREPFAPRLSAEDLLDLGVPLFPLLRRSLAVPRLAGVEYAEDVVANLRLIEQLGFLPTFPRAFYRYCVVPGSLCHEETSGMRFEAAYSAYLARLRTGDGFGLAATRAAALRGFARKRALNRLFMEAHRRSPGLTFQHFMARYRGSAARAFGMVARPAPSVPAAAGETAGLSHPAL